jgi:hypothetical protein
MSSKQNLSLKRRIFRFFFQQFLIRTPKVSCYWYNMHAGPLNGVPTFEPFPAKKKLLIGEGGALLHNVSFLLAHTFQGQGIFGSFLS